MGGGFKRSEGKRGHTPSQNVGIGECVESNKCNELNKVADYLMNLIFKIIDFIIKLYLAYQLYNMSFAIPFKRLRLSSQGLFILNL